MVNPKKVRSMTVKTLYEQKESRGSLKIKEYCEDLPAWKGLARSALAGLILCLLLFVLLFLLFPDILTTLAGRIGDVWAAGLLALTILVAAALYSILSDIVFRRIYTRIRSSLCGYRSETARLETLRNEQDKV